MAREIETSFGDGIAHLRISRPEKKNALTFAMYDALVEGLREADARADVRVVVISGEGGNFTAGNDLTEFAAAAANPTDSSPVRFLRAMSTVEKVVVAEVDGFAIGIGTTMLLHCDLVYASDRARFQVPFVNLALCPEGGASLLLPACAGRLRANALLMFGDPFDAVEARACGLVNEIVPSADLPARVRERALALAAKAPAALLATKRVLRASAAADVQATLGREVAAFVERLQSPEAQEAFAAFMEKRRPDFSRF